jgi:hypothetical protein
VKIGDLIYCWEYPKDWGFIIEEGSRMYNVCWYDGNISWVIKRAVKKCP